MSTPQADEEQTMSKAEMVEKYGDVPLKFSSYYKYSFTFAGTAEDGTVITCAVGGASDDIYRYTVKADVPTSLNLSEWYWAQAKNGDTTLWEGYPR